MTKPEEKKQDAAAWARKAGRFAQGLVIGPALLLALIKLISVAGNLTPFKYQGF